MLKVARTPVTHGDRHNGLAAYSAWAEHLLRDEDFPADEAVLRQRHEVHNDAVGMVAEARWYGSQFLVQVASNNVVHYRTAEDLLHSAACHAAEHDLMWRLWELAGGFMSPDAFRRFADPGVRRRMVPVIQPARDQDLQAAEHVAKTLTKA